MDHHIFSHNESLYEIGPLYTVKLVFLQINQSQIRYFLGFCQDVRVFWS